MTRLSIEALDRLFHSPNQHVKAYAWGALSATQPEYAEANIAILKRRANSEIGIRLAVKATGVVLP